MTPPPLDKMIACRPFGTTSASQNVTLTNTGGTALAITSISNGIDLLGLGTEVKLATQGIVLILATSFDSVVHNLSSGPSAEL